MINRLKRKGLVLIMVSIFAYSITNTIALQNQVIINNNTEIGWHLTKINAQDAWGVTNGSESIVVAIIDSGIDFSHSELSDAAWINTNEIENNGIDDDANGFIDDINGWDFVSIDNTPDNIPGPEPADPINGHATFIAGIITANIDNQGVAGIAPNVKIMDLRVLKADSYAGTTYEEFGEAIKYAVDNGADVINLSLQYYSDSNSYHDDILYAVERNIPVISITGNTGLSLGGGREYRSFPGGYEEVITVGATNYYDERADYSNYGEWTDIVAPVGDQGYDDIAHIIRSTYLHDTYTTGVGTSFACPQVAATVALMKSLYENITIEEVKEILFDTATDLGEEGKDSYFGYGLLNVGKAIQETYERFCKTEKINLPIIVILPAIFIIVLIKKKTNK